MLKVTFLIAQSENLLLVSRSEFFMIKLNKKMFTSDIIVLKDSESGLSEFINSNTIPWDNVTEIKLKGKYYYSFSKRIVHNIDYVKSQRNIYDYFSNVIPLNNNSFAYKKETCYLDYLRHHIGNYFFLKIDIVSFFHSIKESYVRKLFYDYINDEFLDSDKKCSLIDALIKLTSIDIPSESKNTSYINKRVFPIGFSSSPIISEIYFRPIDVLLMKLCSDFELTYTRYADDILISGGINNKYIANNWGFIYNRIFEIFSYYKLKINTRKTINKKKCLSINGYVLESMYYDNRLLFSELRISNFKLKKINKALFYLEENTYIKNETIKYVMEQVFNSKFKKDKFKFKITQSFINRHYVFSLTNKMRGFRAYLLSFIIYDREYMILQKETKDKYLKIIRRIELIIDRLLKN